jgi:hypothetical protein
MRLLIASAAMLALASASEAQSDPMPPRQPPRLIAFDGINLLARAASRQRILSQQLTFRIDVGADGIPTQCDTARNFRRKATTIDLCRPILNYSRFEPATDMSGNAIAGRYEMTIDYNSLIARRGAPDPRDRDRD